jgi:hypothetical protein
MKNLLILTAVIEAGFGLVLLVLPSAASKLLFGSSLDAPAALMVGRLTGAALITLGVACWLAHLDVESRAATGLVAAILLYNLAALAILASAGVGLGLVGVLLWLGVVFHSAMAIWCLACLRTRRINAGDGK